MTVLARKLKTAARRFREGGTVAVYQTGRESFRRWIHRQHRTATIDGCVFSLSGLPDSMIELLLCGKYESAERSLLSTLNPSLPVIELGGCIGVVACTVNRRLADPKRHVVVEAHPLVAKQLRSNRDRNGCSFQIINSAIAHGQGHVYFSASSEYLENRVTGGGTVIVPAITLENVLKELQPPATLICDIEGAECDLIENELAILRSTIARIVVEMHPKLLGPDKASALINRLKESGFRIVGQIGATYDMQNDSLVAGMGRPEPRSPRGSAPTE